MAFEDEYARPTDKKDPIRFFLPFLGVLLILAFAVIAYFAHEPAHEFLQKKITDFPEEKEVGYLVGGVIFVVLMMLASVLYAVLTPGPAKRTSEAELRRDKQDMEREALERKARKKRLRAQAAQERTEREKQQKKRQ